MKYIIMWFVASLIIIYVVAELWANSIECKKMCSVEGFKLVQKVCYCLKGEDLIKQKWK